MQVVELAAEDPNERRVRSNEDPKQVRSAQAESEGCRNPILYRRWIKLNLHHGALHLPTSHHQWRKAQCRNLVSGPWRCTPKAKASNDLMTKIRKKCDLKRKQKLIKEGTILLTQIQDLKEEVRSPSTKRKQNSHPLSSWKSNEWKWNVHSRSERPSTQPKILNL